MSGLSDKDLKKFEKELVKDFEEGKFKSVPDIDEEIRAVKKSAANYMVRNSRINIRLSTSDLNIIKRLAIQEGLPYQTYIASMLHKIASGRLKDAA